MKRKLLFLFIVLGITYSHAQIFTNYSTPDSIYFYNSEGNKQWFYTQKDVFCFKLADGNPYLGNVNLCVDTIKYLGIGESKFNVIYFDTNSSIYQRHNQIMQIINSPNFGVVSIALTNYKNENYTKNKFYRTDDRILITFNNPLLSQEEIDDFASNYNLTLVHAPDPSLPNTVSWTYIFKVLPSNDKSRTTASLAREIYESEGELVKIAEPNLFAVKPAGCNPVSEMGIFYGQNYTWHIQNTGGLVWNGQNGTYDADADICDCWGEGYTGQGVKIGVIDFGGFQFDHPDFENSNIPKAYNTVAHSYTMQNFDPTNNHNPHAMGVVGMIAATPDNLNESNPNPANKKWAVGSAYNSTVIPYVSPLINGSLGATADVTECIQKAVSEGVDVLNMSFTLDFTSSSIKNAINNAVTTGRPNSSTGSLGIICVAGTGGSNDNSYSRFPANMEKVIGVGGTNPNDYRASNNPPGGVLWVNTSNDEGSNYGPPAYHYDVVAPSVLMITTVFTTNFNPNGQNNNWTGGNYLPLSGTSYATAITSSIVAMLLEKNYLLSWQQVRDTIQRGAEKVHQNVYNYHMYSNNDGYNNEMFYGRVSCINTLDLVREVAGLSAQYNEKELTVIYLGNNHYSVFIPKDNREKEYRLFDLSGRLLLNSKTDYNQSVIAINLNEFKSGIYILKILDKDNNVFTTKLIRN